MTPPEFAPRAADRLLFLAPHPDDESLAAGGLLHLAARRGAGLRVLYITRGENNPWAQRVVDWRLGIGPPERARWGEKRWREALDALSALGLPDGCAHCLGLPDQGLSELLAGGDDAPVRLLEEEIERWRPTVLVAPAPWDAHPDHSALGIFTRLALERAGGAAPSLYQYVVHRRTEPEGAGSVKVALDERMTAAKLDAILAHRSQTVLRRGFLLRFVRPAETFTPLHPDVAGAVPHPIRSCRIEGESLIVEMAPRLPFGLGRPQLELLVVDAVPAAAPGDGRAPCRPAGPGWTLLRVGLDLRGGRAFLGSRAIPLRREPGSVRLELPRPGSAGPEPAIYGNVVRPTMRRLGFFDAVGWSVLRGAGRPGGPAGPGSEPLRRREEAPAGAPSLAEVVAAQGFEPRTKGL